jgi:cytochrome c553
MRSTTCRAIYALALTGAVHVGAFAQDTAMPTKAATCVACHGPGGKQPIQADYPRLAGQTARYLYLQMKDFQEGRRDNALMTPMVKGLSREDMQELAAYFAAQTPLPQNFVVDTAKARLGKAKADETLCSMCHLGGFTGQNEIPRVSGQNFAYVVKQLKDFKARTRTNDAGSMTSVANTLNDADIENLAHYIAGL